MGQLIAMSIVQGIPFLAPPVFEYMCGLDVGKINIEILDVPIDDVRLLIQKVCACCNILFDCIIYCNKLIDTSDFPSFREIVYENLIKEVNFYESYQEILKKNCVICCCVTMFCFDVKPRCSVARLASLVPLMALLLGH